MRQRHYSTSLSVVRVALRVLVALLILLTASLSSSASIQPACRDGSLVLNSSTTSVRDLSRCIWYLEDPQQQLDFNTVKDRGLSAFTRHDGGVLNFGYTESAYWVRFDVRTLGSAGASDWILELALPLVDEVRLYLVQGGEVVQQSRAGYQDNWTERDLAVPNPTFRLGLLPDAVNTVYLRITNTNTFRLPLTLWHPDATSRKCPWTRWCGGCC